MTGRYGDAAGADAATHAPDRDAVGAGKVSEVRYPRCVRKAVDDIHNSARIGKCKFSR